MKVHPGSFCKAGGTGESSAGTPMVCSVGPAGGRARWRRAPGATTARERKRRARKPAAAPLAERIRQACQGIAGKSGASVSLARLRDALPEVSRQDLDLALLAGSHAGAWYLDPDPNRAALTSRARVAAVSIGGEDAHLITLAVTS